MTVDPYRDCTDALDAKCAALTAARARERGSLPAVLGDVHAARLGRACAGAAMTAAALALHASALYRLLPGAHPPGIAAAVIAAGLCTAIVAYAAGRVVARRRWAAALADAVAPRGGVHRRLELLRSRSVAMVAHRLLDDVAHASVALPFVGVALLMPLGLHLAADILLHGASWNDLVWFDDWAHTASAVTGHAHVIAAVLAWRHARRLIAAPGGRPRGVDGPFALLILTSTAGWVIAVATVPALGDYAITLVPLVVGTALTGGFLLPAFLLVGGQFRRERWLIAPA
jgi:hypothetical protein